MINRYVFGLLLATLLFGCHSDGKQKKYTKRSSSFTNDTALMSKYAMICRQPSVSRDSCLKLLQLGYNLAKRNGLQVEMVNRLGLMAAMHADQNNLEVSQRYLDSAFRLNDELKDGKMALFLNAMSGAIYQNSGNYAKASTYYIRAIEAVEENNLNKPAILPHLYNNLGGLMMNLKDDSLSRKYLLLAQYYASQDTPVDSGLIANIQFSLGIISMDFDSAAALNYYKNAYRLATRFDVRDLTYNTLINLAKYYIVHRQYDSADYYLRRARDINGHGQIETETTAGILSLSKNDYTTARKHLQIALDLTKGEDYEWLDQIYETFAETYAGLGQYQQAYEFQKKQIVQHEKKMGDPKKTVADFMLNLQSLENEKKMIKNQAQLLAKDTAIKKRNFWIVAMSLSLVLLCIFLAMAYRNYRNRRVLLNERMKALQQNQEIERLTAEAEGADNERSRIAYDIHDGVLVRLANVKMNLTGLHSLAGDSRYQELVGQLDMATKELRNTAHNLMPEILLEEGLEQAIFYFCKATDHASGLNIKFQLVGTAIPRLQPVVETSIYRIVQGLVQNVIQHAKASECLVQVQYADYLCSITVEDNGKGMDNVLQEEGYGFKSIRNRIKILMGAFDIDSTKSQGTTVYLEFDVRPFMLLQASKQ